MFIDFNNDGKEKYFALTLKNDEAEARTETCLVEVDEQTKNGEWE